MKKPNQELFRILKFAIQYPGWHLYQSDVSRHVYRAARLGLFEVNRKSREFRLIQPEFANSPQDRCNCVKPVKKAKSVLCQFCLGNLSESEKLKVHWENPWKDAVPVPIEELAECYTALNELCRTITGSSFILTKEHLLHQWTIGGPADAYILPQPSGNHSIGIRFSNRPNDYLCPEGDKVKVQALLDKYK